MHYIRFLKPPRVLPSSPQTLSAKITVTTDLGESFLCADVSLAVELEHGNKSSVMEAKEYLWKGRDGMRSLEISTPIIATGKRYNYPVVSMLVRPKEDKYAMDTFDAVLGKENIHNSEDSGGIVAVRSMDVYLNGQKSSMASMAERVFSSAGKEIHIWEETGESIARHIWYSLIRIGTSSLTQLTSIFRDAGLVLSSYLSTLSPLTKSSTLKSTSKPHPTNLPVLKRVLSKKNLNILELGAGCGIVGITLSSYFPSSHILLTDLEEASSILTHNLSLLPLSSKSKAAATAKIAHQILDWSQPLPSNVASQSFDLLVVADCTYNPDVVPDLLNTLKSVVERNRDVLVLVAMKVRHESEMVFFELMAESGFVIKEKGEMGLPLLEGEDESIEIFGFQIETKG